MVPQVSQAHTIQTWETNDSNPAELTSHAALYRFSSTPGLIEFGTRVWPPTAVTFHRLSPSFGTLVSGSLSELIYSADVQPNSPRLSATLQVRMNTNFRGAARITFYARTPGSQTDFVSKTFLMSSGQFPAPSRSIPIDFETVSPAPVFRGQTTTTYTVPAVYEIEVTGATNRTWQLPSQDTNANFTYYTPLDDGFQPGDYSWRVRALDERGKPGVWSTNGSMRIFGGIDMAGFGSTTFFQTMRNAGWSTFFAAGWGGRTIWPDARNNLIRAHNAGFKVAVYTFLNFDNGSTIGGAPANQTGAWQVDQTLAGIGFTGNKSSLPYDLKYVMIDIENRFWGSMSQADRVHRIAEACQRARNLGFWPMIYTRNEGVNQWWNDATGSSRDFREMWLWDSKPESSTAVYKDHLTLNQGVAWTPYGGWRVRGGKQYLLDVTIAGGRVDFNTWDPEVWDVNSPNPGSINVVPANVTVARNTDNTYKVNITLTNSGNIEAYAVRLGNASLGSSVSTGRTTLGMILPNGSRSGFIDFPATAGAPGESRQLDFEIWTGNGMQTHSTWVVLP
ncbi:hypothetical protein QM565_37565 [Geitlerinema splendidum]|nr:hypothetical protein [Geitlerinema splendidum]